VYRPRRRGARLLLDLPHNLARLDAGGSAVRAPFEAVLGPDAARAADGQRALRASRIAQAFRFAEQRGARAADSTSAYFEERLLAARNALPDDPDLRRFEDEVAFLADIQTGVSLLRSSPERAAAEAALEPLISAAERRRERADVHLYAAVALARLSSPAAEKALGEALRRCPAIARTEAGEIAAACSMPPDMWKRLVLASHASRFLH
jgi:hypothetical protein